MVIKLYAVLFALSMWNAYDVPVHYGMAVYEASIQENVDPYAMGGLLLAENRGRHYDPRTVGRYGKGGELGLYQLAPHPWSGHCGIHPDQLKHPGHNIRCAAKSVRWMMERSRLSSVRDDWAEVHVEAVTHYRTAERRLRKERTHDKLDWRTHYRCHPKYRASQRCGWSVARVRRHQKRVIDWMTATDTPYFWAALLIRLPRFLHVHVQQAALLKELRDEGIVVDDDEVADARENADEGT